ncbi:MAG: hypothetical protein BWY66_02116 [bacterium ADurb.Bin374]|nr:MAG: hypothetical protein BWY66_02116 [bacterium ADurb.Bin374]
MSADSIRTGVRTSGKLRRRGAVLAIAGGGRNQPLTTARYVFSTLRASNWADSFPAASELSAITSTPDVARSSRWTGNTRRPSWPQIIGSSVSAVASAIRVGCTSSPIGLWIATYHSS